MDSLTAQNEVFTDSGLPVKSLYTARDLPSRDQDEEPGRYPYMRGIHPRMYRERLWTMREYTGFGTAEETNARFKFLLRQGQTGLSIAFDLPTQLGLDSDHLRAAGEVGRVGVPVSSLHDMQTVLDDIPLGEVSTSMTINATAAILLAYYATVAEAQGVPASRLRGTTQNDILKEFIARNTYIYPPRPSLKLAVDLIEYCARALPKWYPISISGYHMREAGATAVQELAYTFANAREYVDATRARGLRIEEFAPRLSFFFACRNEFLEEVAKFRAARRIWARMMRDEYGTQDPEAQKLRFHVQTSGESLTAQQPNNNVVRVALQALAAVLGGTQSLHTNARDEALSLPTEESAKLALRTQQIIAYETGVTKTVDPLAGSYYVERLTEELETAAWAELGKVQRLGGALRAIEEGYIQREIQESAYRFQRELDGDERVVVGVNRFRDGRDPRIRIHRIDPRSEERQKRRLNAVRQRRNRREVERALRAVHRRAEREANVMPAIREAVKLLATTGEISDALRAVYGEFRPRLVS